jgi:hypothetical protein
MRGTGKDHARTISLIHPKLEIVAFALSEDNKMNNAFHPAKLPVHRAEVHPLPNSGVAPADF